MLVSELSVDRFLRLPFSTLSDGGYAGLVFVVARPADAPDLNLRFFRDWTDIHHLTGRYLAVVTPEPGSRIALPESRFPTMYGTEVREVTCLGDTKRLSDSILGSRSSVRMASREPGVHTVVAPTRLGSVREHQVALTGVVGEMQEFFGISESLLPCAVVVSLQERAVFAVALENSSSVYGLLKRIKTEIEPVTALISEKEAELAAAKEARRRVRMLHDWGKLRDAADAVRGAWTSSKARVADDLAEIAREWGGEDAELCRWIGARLNREEPLTAAERVSARALLDALRAAGTSGSLHKRLRRTLAKLTSGYPSDHEAVARLDAANAAVNATQRAIGQVKAALDDLGHQLRLGAATEAAGAEFGLMPTQEWGLLPRRQLTWPITVLARPDAAAPTLRFERA